jgi:two-component system response regulator ChvI
MALAQLGGAGRGSRLMLVLEDRLLRESLAMTLVEDGFRVLEFSDADAALAEIEAGNDVEALVVDAGAKTADETAGEPGAAPRARLRAARCASPVYLLSADGESRTAAERWGAVGVIDRHQASGRIKGTLVNAIRAGALLAEPGAATAARHGPLVFSAGGTRVSWRGCHLDLGPSERALLAGLVAAPEAGLTTQRAQAILDEAHGPDAEDRPDVGATGASGGGAAGGPERVKSLIRRLRKKFREVDPNFDQIVFVPGCGYGWRTSAPPPNESLRRGG